MDIWMVVEVFNRQVERKTLVHGHSAAIRKANEWMKTKYANTTDIYGHEYANEETNCAWITYSICKGYDVYVLEVS